MTVKLVGVTLQVVLLYALGLWYLLGGADPAAGRALLGAFLIIVMFFSGMVVDLLWGLHRRVRALEQQAVGHDRSSPGRSGGKDGVTGLGGGAGGEPAEAVYESSDVKPREWNLPTN